MPALDILLPGLISVLGRFIPDADARAKAQEEITRQILANEATIIASARDVVTAEIGSGNALASSWRPVLMYLLMFLLLGFFVGGAFGFADRLGAGMRAIPESLFTLLQIGLGGYIVGRSGEKIASAVAGKVGR